MKRILFLIALVSCHKEVAKPVVKEAPRFPVEVAEVKNEKVQYDVTAVGSIEAFERIQVTAKVPGTVERVKFSEGDTVRKDQVLVEIDLQRYQLAAKAAGAMKERAEGAKTETQAGLERRQQAVEQNPGIIPGEEIAGWQAKVQSLSAESEQARIGHQQALLNLRDAQVRAPVDGIIQTRTVQTGQYVQPGIVLATLLQRNPLLLRFQIPAEDAGRLQRGMIVNFKTAEHPEVFNATLKLIAEAANESSRQVQVTAEIDKKQAEKLRAGSFAEVSIPIPNTSESLVVPQTAVLPTERGFVVYVIDNDTAEERQVELGMRTKEGLVEIRKGIEKGETIVVRGNESLHDGALITRKQ